MNRTRLGAQFATFLVLGAARAASAQVCAEIDTARDALNEGERASAKILLAQTLEKEGKHVAETGCTETYKVSHLRFGNSVTVYLQGPQGTRQATVGKLEEVPAIYSQMVRSLLRNQPMNVGTGDTITRDNVTAQQAVPTRAAADSLWYGRLGYGVIPVLGVTSGPGFGIGYRYELDNFAVDLSLGFMISTEKNGKEGGASGSWIKLEGLYFTNPVANRSPYFGGGVSWGGVGLVSDSGKVLSDTGLQGELTAGYEFLRASTIRMFGQFDVTLPFYTAKEDFLTGMTSGDTAYAPTLMFSLGLGFGRSNSVGVRIL